MISLTSQRLIESERASFFSLVTSGSALGTLLTGILGSYVLENYKWDVVFRVLGMLSKKSKKKNFSTIAFFMLQDH